MKLKILLFAGLADRFSANTLSVQIEDKVVTAAKLLDRLIQLYPDHTDALRPCFIARNREYADPDQQLFEQDELALIPPVSGGQEAASDESEDHKYVITLDPIDVEAVVKKVTHRDHGASIAFIGTTRERTAGETTIRLEYEAYTPMAVKLLRQIGDEMLRKWPQTLCAITHRLGLVQIGEISVVIATSAPHRDDCYEANRFAIERLKQIVPIWKKEVWEDGTQWRGHQLGPWKPI